VRYERVVEGETLFSEELSGLRHVLEVVRSHIVGKDEDDVGLGRRSCPFLGALAYRAARNKEGRQTYQEEA
jgi:hypothetical protein